MRHGNRRQHGNYLMRRVTDDSTATDDGTATISCGTATDNGATTDEGAATDNGATTDEGIIYRYAHFRALQRRGQRVTG